jgi:hypothetical protein
MKTVLMIILLAVGFVLNTLTYFSHQNAVAEQSFYGLLILGSTMICGCWSSLFFFRTLHNDAIKSALWGFTLMTVACFACIMSCKLLLLFIGINEFYSWLIAVIAGIGLICGTFLLTFFGYLSDSEG